MIAGLNGRMGGLRSGRTIGARPGSGPGIAALLMQPTHAQDAYDTCFGEVLAAAADTRFFGRGRWSFRDDNTALQSIHYLGAGNFVHAGRTLQARVL